MLCRDITSVTDISHGQGQSMAVILMPMQSSFLPSRHKDWGGAVMAIRSTQLMFSGIIRMGELLQVEAIRRL